MSSAIIVIGANYGDEGKGAITNYVANKTTLNVRFNGGAQAGHTVLHNTYGRHVFHHHGAGTFKGASTFLKGDFICNPVLFREEADHLKKLMGDAYRNVFVSEYCLISTPYDMILNQLYERKMNHGSCGMGIWETAMRCHADFDRAIVKSFKEGNIEAHIRHIRDVYAPERAEYLDVQLPDYWCSDDLFEMTVESFKYFLDNVIVVSPDHFNGIPGQILFEGAQGLLLFEQYGELPHVTWGDGSARHAASIARDMGIIHIEVMYVTRTYLTRHGNGPLRGGTDRVIGFHDDTNVYNEWQGSMRFADLDTHLGERIAEDAGNLTRHLVVTHWDQYGEDSEHVLSVLANASKGCAKYTLVSSDGKSFQSLPSGWFQNRLERINCVV